jgi:hypothetical protein
MRDRKTSPPHDTPPPYTTCFNYSEPVEMITSSFIPNEIECCYPAPPLAPPKLEYKRKQLASGCVLYLMGKPAWLRGMLGPGI